MQVDINTDEGLRKLISLSYGKSANQFHMDTGLAPCNIIAALAYRLLKEEKPFDYDLEQMQAAMNSGEVYLPNDIEDIESFDAWLNKNFGKGD